MFNNERTETRTFFLKTSSCNYQRRASNADFVVHTPHTPIELNNGVTGVSLVSAAFPQNQVNVTADHNTLRWQFDVDAKNNPFTGAGPLTFEWRWRVIGGTWSAVQTYTAINNELNNFTDVPSWVTEINTGFQAAYNTLTSRTSTEVAFGTLTTGTETSIVTFAAAPAIEVELAPGTSTYLSVMGINPPQNNERVDNYNNTDSSGRRIVYIGEYSPTSYTTTVPAGQYSTTDLTAVLLADFKLYPLATPSAANIVSIGEISDIDQRLKITTAAGYEIILWGIDFGSTLGPLIGTSIDVVSKTASTDTTLSYVANLYGPSVCYLHSQLLAGRTTLDGDSGGIVSIVKQIPITAGYREMQCYNNDDNGVPDISFPLSRRKHFSEVDVALKDQHGRVLDIGAGELEVMWKLYY